LIPNLIRGLDLLEAAEKAKSGGEAGDSTGEHGKTQLG
jgi:hypothetical protein